MVCLKGCSRCNGDWCQGQGELETESVNSQVMLRRREGWRGVSGAFGKKEKSEWRWFV